MTGAPNIYRVEFRRTYTPHGGDPVVQRHPLPLDGHEDHRRLCRKLLEDKVQGVRGSQWPGVGSVHVLDSQGRELAKYDYLDLLNDRSRERMALRGEKNAYRP